MSREAAQVKAVLPHRDVRGEMRTVDLFAGPGGWDLAAHRLGLDPLGVEWDDAACATRGAAGLRTVQADVAELDPLDYGPCDLLIASPPCQAWSTAGKGGGRRDIDLCVRAVHDLAAGNDTRAGLAAKCEDRRSILVAEPLRWALALKPRLLAWEQVPPVLGMWSLCAQLLGQAGYFTAVGLLSSERYGVPQTRQRAFLIASTDGPVALPMPTHQRYVASKKMDPNAVGLFDVPERERIVVPEDRHLLPWVSMAQALGWDEHDHPAPTVMAGGVAQGGRKRIAAARNIGGRDWVDGRPATTIAGDSRVFQPGGHHEPGQQSQNAVRVSVQEASILQSFPPDYPWQGSRTKQYEQIGNAVPPTMAQAVLGALLDADCARLTGGSRSFPVDHGASGGVGS